MMDHPNVAKVLVADAAESGRPYFAIPGLGIFVNSALRTITR
jgi:hypothetical protein